VIARSVTVAVDGYVFIGLAELISDGRFAELFHHAQHPFYPFCIWCVSRPVLASGLLPELVGWELSGQLAAAFWGVLLVIPMYGLGRRALDRPAAFWGTLLFVLLPVPARIAADALSDTPLLCLELLALWLGLLGLERKRLGPILLAFVLVGLAYLTRPEGLRVAAILAAALLVAQAHPRWRFSRRQLLLLSIAVAVTLACIAGPYAALIGGLSQKHSLSQVLQPGTAPAVPVGEAAYEVIEELGLAEKMSHVSTGGGACLHFLRGRELPALEPLRG